jgi:hypothetical protein
MGVVKMCFIVLFNLHGAAESNNKGRKFGTQCPQRFCLPQNKSSARGGPLGDVSATGGYHSAGNQGGAAA